MWFSAGFCMVLIAFFKWDLGDKWDVVLLVLRVPLFGYGFFCKDFHFYIAMLF